LREEDYFHPIDFRFEHTILIKHTVRLFEVLSCPGGGEFGYFKKNSREFSIKLMVAQAHKGKAHPSSGLKLTYNIVIKHKRDY
jgi:hypothetical protein